MRWLCWVTALVCVCINLFLNIGALKDFQWKVVVLKIHGNYADKMVCQSWKSFPRQHVCIFFDWMGLLNLKLVSSSPVTTVHRKILSSFIAVMWKIIDLLWFTLVHPTSLKRNCERGILSERKKLHIPFEAVRCVWGGSWKEASVTCRHMIISDAQHYEEDEGAVTAEYYRLHTKRVFLGCRRELLFPVVQTITERGAKL